MSTATFQFSESGGSVNGPNLFTELPFLYNSLPNPCFTELPPPFSPKTTFFHWKMLRRIPFLKIGSERSRRVLFRGCFDSRRFSEILAFRSSDSQSLNQGCTRRSRLSTMSALKRRKPLANKSNKSTTPHPPRQHGNDHTFEILHDGIGVDHLRALCQKPRGKTAYDIATLRKKTPTMLAKTFRQMTAHNRNLPQVFCAWLQNLRKSLQVSENLWKPLKISEILWKSLKTSATRTSRREPTAAGPLQDAFERRRISWQTLCPLPGVERHWRTFKSEQHGSHLFNLVNATLGNQGDGRTELGSGGLKTSESLPVVEHPLRHTHEPLLTFAWQAK